MSTKIGSEMALLRDAPQHEDFLTHERQVRLDYTGRLKLVEVDRRKFEHKDVVERVVFEVHGFGHTPSICGRTDAPRTSRGAAFWALVAQWLEYEGDGSTLKQIEDCFR